MNTKIQTLTLSGPDENTSIESLGRLIDDFPFVELGILISATPEGRNRYPGLDWVSRVVAEFGQRCAIHICGHAARDLFLTGGLDRILQAGGGRVQLNGKISPLLAFQAACKVPSLITQHNPDNEACKALPLSNHSLLIDSSAGNGITPREWPDLGDLSRPVGRAGGLGPDNLVDQLADFHRVAGTGAWVDMEAKLRDKNDLFDISRARACATIFQEFLEAFDLQPQESQ
jgi:hypothetical protein